MVPLSLRLTSSGFFFSFRVKLLWQTRKLDEKSVCMKNRGTSTRGRPVLYLERRVRWRLNCSRWLNRSPSSSSRSPSSSSRSRWLAAHSTAHSATSSHARASQDHSDRRRQADQQRAHGRLGGGVQRQWRGSVPRGWPGVLLESDGGMGVCGDIRGH